MRKEIFMLKAWHSFSFLSRLRLDMRRFPKLPSHRMFSVLQQFAFICGWWFNKYIQAQSWSTLLNLFHHECIILLHYANNMSPFDSSGDTVLLWMDPTARRILLADRLLGNELRHYRETNPMSVSAWRHIQQWAESSQETNDVVHSVCWRQQ